jgi:hypothetical protein
LPASGQRKKEDGEQSKANFHAAIAAKLMPACQALINQFFRFLIAGEVFVSDTSSVQLYEGVANPNSPKQPNKLSGVFPGVFLFLQPYGCAFK